ncbi:undecaprenyl-diphosphate phosphatase [Aneurinibacillus thermoaerophilus]|uniref:Undecaprenyl-diphosphatase n=1 Tax=Aneurinibacillus thermoaerophilus TaxID=143495 RepID=A0A1G8E1H9_ANETH|nr:MULTISPECIES: undecaprenyl-diphosphate phosphatase [Aneurinibacillus]AMA74139.1 undecaprenyl-diphosphatase [Aneurinibacillus sp. XH2]MED0677283.1 undecaprenyl-diphosphate phosphatase [Aneurinibacillus thermoaerophilus]MED0677904.1 undecaprenyl-diphosphate phosphatase [Aneurinibacillus thermoaerophilus]MED0758413.1 undecaprenyl-diphosphate phosphatase [Aneurinibacillus thermoaerophilus]MED0760424.1 undecaprenyl-diphosphate phosphatase [Aneurinibacillus thermoaerophilus]
MGEYVTAIILGIVEGLTEFLPVSSTGHLILTETLLGATEEKWKTFAIVIQLGSICAVLLLFWKRILGLLGISRRHALGPQLNLLHIIIGILPAGIAGVLLHDFIKEKLFSAWTVLLSLIIGGILMIAAEKLQPRATARTVDDISYRQAFGIGLFQCLALWPGFSRSGATIAGGILLGTSHKAAAEFTFILAIPVMMGATGLDLIKSWDYLSVSDFGFFATGFITAMVVAMLAIVSFLKLLERVSLTPFAIYRFALAVVFYFFILK